MYYQFQSEDGEPYGSFETFMFRGAWWWQAGFPGCLPDDDASGPFPTEQDAINIAREV